MSNRGRIEQNRQTDMHSNDGPTSSRGIWVNLVVGTKNCLSGSRWPNVAKSAHVVTFFVFEPLVSLQVLMKDRLGAILRRRRKCHAGRPQASKANRVEQRLTEGFQGCLACL
jgi:hypothetical protein